MREAEREGKRKRVRERENERERERGRGGERMKGRGRERKRIRGREGERERGREGERVFNVDRSCSVIWSSVGVVCPVWSSGVDKACLSQFFDSLFAYSIALPEN